MRKNEESLICPGDSLGWITGWVWGSATQIEDCRESRSWDGEREANSVLGLLSSGYLWGHLGGGVYPADTSLKNEKVQEEVIRTGTDSGVLGGSRG